MTTETDIQAAARISAWQKFANVESPLIFEICQAYEQEKAAGLVTERPTTVRSSFPPLPDMKPILKTCTIEEVPGGYDVYVKTNSSFDKQEGGTHYKDMPSQPFKFIRDNNVPHAEGECIYRLLRWRKKGGVDDLRKVIHTVELIIEAEGQGK